MRIDSIRFTIGTKRYIDFRAKLLPSVAASRLRHMCLEKAAGCLALDMAVRGDARDDGFRFST